MYSVNSEYENMYRVLHLVQGWTVAACSTLIVAGVSAATEAKAQFGELADMYRGLFGRQNPHTGVLNIRIDNRGNA